MTYEQGLREERKKLWNDEHPSQTNSLAQIKLKGKREGSARLLRKIKLNQHLNYVSRNIVRTAHS